MGSLDVLLKVQELDTTLDQLRHKRATLAERDRVAAAHTAAAQAAVAVDQTFARLHELQSAQKALEDEAATVADKIHHVDRMLYGGTVKAAKELEAYQADMAMLRRRADELDDKVLELMEQVEPMEAELAQRRSESEQATATVEAAEAALLVAEAEVDAEIAEVEGRRGAAAAEVDAAVIGEYESLRSGLGGVGAARLLGSRCEGCHLEIPSAQLEQVRRAPADSLVTCPECSRILVR